MDDMSRTTISTEKIMLSLLRQNEELRREVAALQQEVAEILSDSITRLENLGFGNDDNNN